MSRLIFHNDYIIVVPTYGNVEMHKHMMPHLFISDPDCMIDLGDKQVAGSIVMLDSNVRHANIANHHRKLFLLIDAASILAKQMKTLYLKKEYGDEYKEYMSRVNRYLGRKNS